MNLSTEFQLMHEWDIEQKNDYLKEKPAFSLEYGILKFISVKLFFDYRDVKRLQVGNALFDGDGPFAGLVRFEFIHHPIADGAFNAACV